jgi:hypothetical protein
MNKQSTVKESIAVTAGIVLLAVCGIVAAKSLPSYEYYCKEPQARCELNHQGSLTNLYKTLKDGPKNTK